MHRTTSSNQLNHAQPPLLDTPFLLILSTPKNTKGTLRCFANAETRLFR